MNMFVGLTGKIACGKNYVSGYMEKLGWKVLDLDVLCRSCYVDEKDEIINLFGTDDRREIAGIVFDDSSKLRLLENLLYPVLKYKILLEASAQPDAGIIVLNGALLYRAGLDRLCRYVLYVEASYNVRLARAYARNGISADDFSKRNRSQNDVDYRDVEYRSELIVIDNEEDCTNQLEEVCMKISQTPRTETESHH